MSTPDTLRSEIRVAVTTSGISQSKIAYMVGCTEKHLSQMLTGKVPMASYWADRIAALCGYRVSVRLEKLDV